MEKNRSHSSSTSQQPPSNNSTLPSTCNSKQAAPVKQSNQSYSHPQQRNRSYQEQQQQSNRSYPQRQGAEYAPVFRNNSQSLGTNYAGGTDRVDEKIRRESRSKRFGNARANLADNSYARPKTVAAGVSSRRNYYQGGNNTVVKDSDSDLVSVKGTCQQVEKCYLRLTSAPDPATVILIKLILAF